MSEAVRQDCDFLVTSVACFQGLLPADIHLHPSPYLIWQFSAAVLKEITCWLPLIILSCLNHYGEFEFTPDNRIELKSSNSKETDTFLFEKKV